MLLSDVDLKSYTDIAYHNEELKSLTRYRFDKVQERAKLKQSVSRLATILFPELEGLVSSIHGTSIYALLSEYPGTKQISEVHLTKLTNLLTTASKGRYGKEKAIQIREAARASIGSVMPAKSLELKHTIKLIQELASEINEIEDSIQKIIDELNPPILSIPGMGVNSAAVILAEIGDFSNFSSPDKILAYAGCSPSTYQSGKLTNCYAHMENVAPATCDMPFTTQPSTSATGILSLLNTLPKTCRRKTLQCCPVPCHEETRSVDLCLTEIRESISCSCMIFS